MISNYVQFRIGILSVPRGVQYKPNLETDYYHCVQRGGGGHCYTFGDGNLRTTPILYRYEDWLKIAVSQSRSRVIVSTVLLDSYVGVVDQWL